MEVKKNQRIGDKDIQCRWTPILVVGITAHGDAPVSVEPMPDGTAVLHVGGSQILCDSVKLALCSACGWVAGRIEIVYGHANGRT